MRKREIWILSGCKIASVYVGTVIGAGFASGQEIMQFFTLYGLEAFWAILLSTVLFVWIGKKVLELGRNMELNSFKGLVDFIFGPLGPLVNGYLIISILVIGGAMFAGAGAMFAEHLAVPSWLGVAITAILALLTVVFGLSGLMAVNGIFVPLIFIFNILIFAFSVMNQNNIIINIQYMPATPLSLIKTGISYASFNLILSIGILCPMGKEAKDKRALILGGSLGGILLGIMLMMGHYILWLNAPEIYNYEIPVLYIVQRIGLFFFYLYAVVFWGEIFTTLVSNLYSVSSILDEVFKIPPWSTSLLMLAITIALSLFGFTYIVSWFYPLLGLIGFVFIIILLLPIKRA